MLKKEAIKITGGLSTPSKMPGPAHNLPAAACKTGAKLAQIPGSVCSGCYALKGRYRFNNVQKTEERKNRFNGESVMLTAEEARRHDNIFINELAATLEDQEAGIDGHSEKWKSVRRDLDWFRQHNAKAYMVLLD